MNPEPPLVDSSRFEVGPPTRNVAAPQTQLVAHEVASAPEALPILGTRVHAISCERAVDQILRWAHSGQSRYVCAASVNNIMTAYDQDDFRTIMNSADLVVPDGMPLVWALQLFGAKTAERVRGTNLTEELCARAAEQAIPVGLFGGTPEVLERLVSVLVRRWPTLELAYRWSPPFGPLSLEEDAAVVNAITSSGARLLFLGLSTPKQDRWMSSHRGRVPAVMLGVGAAFDFLAGAKPQAPEWMQRAGLEWLFRLMIEPRRLWRRYLLQNPRFLVAMGIATMSYRLRHFMETRKGGSGRPC